jgi:hypothetical protein
VVIKKGWQEAAKPILLAAIQKPPVSFDSDWFNVIVDFKDPAAYGHHDALDYLFKVLAAHADPIPGLGMPETRTAIRDCLASTDLGDDWAAWYAKNGDRLVYDVNLRKFVVK